MHNLNTQTFVYCHIFGCGTVQFFLFRRDFYGPFEINFRNKIRQSYY